MLGLQPAADQEEDGNNGKQVDADKGPQEVQHDADVESKERGTKKNCPATMLGGASQECDYGQGKKLNGKCKPGSFEDCVHRRLNRGGLHSPEQEYVSAGMEDARAKEDQASEGC